MGLSGPFVGIESEPLPSVGPERSIPPIGPTNSLRRSPSTRSRGTPDPSSTVPGRAKHSPCSHPDVMQRVLVLAALLSAPITTSSSATVRPVRSLPGGVEKVQIKTSDDVRLAATYYSPRKNERAPAVLLVHDAGGAQDQLASIAESLNKKGFGVLTIDLRGHGDSKAVRLDWEDLGEDGRAALWQLAPRDIDAAATWILGQKDIHSTNLSIVGYRAGCALAARHAEQDENVIAMALLQPKSKDFGFDVEKTIQNVHGLPTYVLAQRNPDVERMVTEANSKSNKPWITWDTVAAKPETVLDDRKTATKVSGWLAEVALPKKGR